MGLKNTPTDGQMKQGCEDPANIQWGRREPVMAPHVKDTKEQKAVSGKRKGQTLCLLSPPFECTVIITSFYNNPVQIKIHNECVKGT